jgi:hypothetical protein
MKPIFTVDPELLRGVEFELAYLSLLTREKLKPLSRWEKPFDSGMRDRLRGLGLSSRVVERSVQSGRHVQELVMSASEEWIEAYAARFAGSPVRKDPETIRFEGGLFGYPACCVDHFATRGYARNTLRQRDQRLLFHWACPGCRVTPAMLLEYRRVYRVCRAARRGAAWRAVPGLIEALTNRRIRTGLAAAASLAALGVLPPATVPVSADPLDPHVSAFTLSDDSDGDYLIGSEEVILGFDAGVSDQNTNAVPDGVDLAVLLSRAVDALPEAPSATKPFVTHYSANGVETCQVCGEIVNMGYMEIRHPLENQSVSVSYVAKHFLEHGSFSYSGSVHSGRVVVPLLQFLLESDGRGHLIPEPAGTDSDGDGLRDWEEPTFGTNAEKGDTDGDQLPDGIDAARELRATLDTLPVVARPEDGPKDRPFVMKQMMFGVETCPRCGETWAMGYWSILNPVIGEEMTVPTMALHYLEHGAFTWCGGQLLKGQGRVDPRQLLAVLNGKPNSHTLPVAADSDGDFLTDLEELSLGQNPGNADENGNAVADGLDLARLAACEIAGLPTTPCSDRVYRLDFPLRGLEHCDICGTNVNMGYLVVTNPVAKLSVEVPYIALHYLEHDSLSFAGDVHGNGRLDPKALREALFGERVSLQSDARFVTLRWIARTGRSYQVYAAADLQGPWNAGPVFQGYGTEVIHTETRPLGAAKRFYRVTSTAAAR